MVCSVTNPVSVMLKLATTETGIGLVDLYGAGVIWKVDTTEEDVILLLDTYPVSVIPIPVTALAYRGALFLPAFVLYSSARLMLLDREDTAMRFSFGNPVSVMLMLELADDTATLFSVGRPVSVMLMLVLVATYQSTVAVTTG